MAQAATDSALRWAAATDVDCVAAVLACSAMWVTSQADVVAGFLHAATSPMESSRTASPSDTFSKRLCYKCQPCLSKGCRSKFIHDSFMSIQKSQEHSLTKNGRNDCARRRRRKCQTWRRSMTAEEFWICDVTIGYWKRHQPVQRPDQRVADERLKFQCDQEMMEVPPVDRIRTSSSEEAASKVCPGMDNTSLKQWRQNKPKPTSRPDVWRNCAEKEADYPETNQDPAGPVGGEWRGLCGAETSQWGLKTQNP